MRIIWYRGWPWRWHFRLVRRSHYGPFGEIVLGPVGFVWYTERKP